MNNKSLITLIVAGSLLAGGAMAQGEDFSSRDTYFRIRDARLQRDQINSITNTVNNSINTPKPLLIKGPSLNAPSKSAPHRLTIAEQAEVLRRRAAMLESQAINNDKEASRLTDEAKKASSLWPLFRSKSGMLNDQSYNLLVESIRLREQAEFYKNQAENLGFPPKF